MKNTSSSEIIARNANAAQVLSDAVFNNPNDPVLDQVWSAAIEGAKARQDYGLLFAMSQLATKSQGFTMNGDQQAGLDAYRAESISLFSEADVEQFEQSLLGYADEH